MDTIHSDLGRGIDPHTAGRNSDRILGYFHPLFLDSMLAHWKSKCFIARWRWDCCEHHLGPYFCLASLEGA